MFIGELDASPLSNLDYGFDYSEWLTSSETITDSSWEITPTATLSNYQNLNDICSVFVEVPATVGVIYKLTNAITTSVGRTDSRTMVLSCKRL